MQRVMIVGQPGSGKSTLARAMGQITGLPVVHIDHIHWQPGWIERPRDQKTALCRNVHARDRWIFEGGHSATWPERLSRADTLIWLDYPVGQRFRRVLGRSWRYLGKTRPDLPDGCPERLIARDFLSYIWRTRHSGRAAIARLFGSLPADKTGVRLRDDAAVAAYLDRLSAANSRE